MDPITREGKSAVDVLNGENPSEGKVYHLAGWNRWPDQRKIRMLRRLAKEYGADPKMRWFTADILKKSGAQPRDYRAQAAALLAFVQTHVYYTNEPGEQIQSPWRTLKVHNGDCDDCSLLLATMAESINLPWRYALGGYRMRDPKRVPQFAAQAKQAEATLRNPQATAEQKQQAQTWMDRASRVRVRWVEGQRFPPGNVRWIHIYVMLGWPPFEPRTWASAEATVRGMQLGQDVVLHGIPAGLNGGRDLGGWGDAQPAVVGQIVDPGYTGVSADPAKSGFIRGLIEQIDYPGALNSVIQGVITAVAIGWVGHKLGRKSGV